MNADRPTISIVMLTRNRAAFTLHCLDSLAKTDYPIEWIIVDNGSNDETRTYLHEWSGRSNSAVQFIWNRKDYGSCRARNQGLEAARSDLVLFLDNDIMLEELGWLEKLARPMRDSLSGSHGSSNSPPIVAATPLLLFPGMSRLIQCAGGGVTASGRVGLIGRARQDGPDWAVENAIAWGTTAALLVQKAALRRVGGFDEGFDPVSVCEDIDLCCRLRAAGGQILFVGASRLRHFEGITFNHLGYDKRAYWLRHMRVIKNRWFDVLTSGPLHSNEDVRWRPVIKDYSDLKRPHVRLPNPDEQNGDLPQFFSPFLDLAVESPPSLRLAVIGCGQAALRGTLPGFSPPGSAQAQRAAPFLSFDGTPDVTLAAVCDVEGRRASDAARQFGVHRVETVAERLLDEVPIEAVCICSPPFAHASQTLAALTRGIPVLVEKPPVVNEAELQEVLAAKKRHGGLPVMVNLPWVFHPAVEAARGGIAAGALGTIRRVDTVFEHSGPESWAPGSAWYREHGMQTLVLDLALHVACAAERLFEAQVSFVKSASPPGGSDRAQAQFLIGTIDASITVGWDAPKPQFVFNVYGSNASLSINLIPWRIVAAPSAIRVETDAGKVPGLDLEIGANGGLWMLHSDAPFQGGPYRHFADSLKTGRTAITDLEIVANAMDAVLRWAAQVPDTW